MSQGQGRPEHQEEAFPRAAAAHPSPVHLALDSCFSGPRARASSGVCSGPCTPPRAVVGGGQPQGWARGRGRILPTEEAALLDSISQVTGGVKEATHWYTVQPGFEPHGSNSLIPECGPLPPTLPGPTGPAWGACPSLLSTPLLPPSLCTRHAAPSSWERALSLHHASVRMALLADATPGHLIGVQAPRSHSIHLPFTAHATTWSFRRAFTRLTTIVPSRHVAFGSVSPTSQPTALGGVQPIITITASSIHPSWTTCHVPSPSLHPASIRHGPRATFHHHHCIQHPSVMDHVPRSRPSAVPTFSQSSQNLSEAASCLPILHIKTLRCPRGRPGRAPMGMSPQQL